jgi:predicted flap endonuclease-1-like 5' DNA nuclease
MRTSLAGGASRGKLRKLVPQRARDPVADTPDVRPVGDLPNAIGKTAARVLADAGITSLADVASRSPKELLAMHGMGPKAISVLSEALAAQGRSFTAS